MCSGKRKATESPAIPPPMMATSNVCPRVIPCPISCAMHVSFLHEIVFKVHYTKCKKNTSLQVKKRIGVICTLTMLPSIPDNFGKYKGLLGDRGGLLGDPRVAPTIVMVISVPGN